MFATADERDAACADLAKSGHIVAELEGIGPSMRGRLAEAIDEQIERELAARGAAGGGGGPGIGAEDPEAVLGEQLFRARRAGAAGIAIVLGPLRACAIAGPLGAMDPADCATLRFLAAAARDLPVTLLLDARDRTTLGHAEPVPLSYLLEDPAREPVDPAKRATPARALSLAQPPATPHVSAAATGHLPAAAPTPAVAVPAPSPALSAALAPAATETGADPTWHLWIRELAEARGPQPLTALERLFAQSYMPLTNAIANGLDDPRARIARDDFRDTFAAGYVDAFPTFAATTKRPRMVFDVHDHAARIARLHGARTVRLLLCDAMRWDLSRSIEERLLPRLGTRAAIADELLLWSALPTTTMRQLETIGRGIDALRSPAILDPEAEPPRERNADHIRRIRVGARELHKLDLIESRVRALRGGLLRALPDVAEATAHVLARYAETLAPRTLLFVFGDHGFAVDKSGLPSQGGASPEEVLVGAFAVLVGDVH